MSWITKAENLLNNLDKKASNVLQQTQLKSEEAGDSGTTLTFRQSPSLPRNASISKNILILSKSTPKKESLEQQEWDSMSERSISSIKTQIEHNDNDQYIMIKERVPSVENFSVEKELASTKILLSEMRSENNELRMEIETLHEQLKSNNNAMKIRELEEVSAVLVDEKRDLMLMNQSLESSTANYIKTISDLETNIMKLQQSENEIKQKLEYSITENKDVKQELQNYKLRAQNQLQLKEKLIEQLKLGDGETESDGDVAAIHIEIDQIRSERDHIQADLNLVSKRLDESRSFIEKLEHKHRIMEAAAEDKINALNDTISKLNNASVHFEDEIRLQKQEIQQVREEMLSQKKIMTTKLHDKENELKRLKNTYRESQVNSEIENRVQSLTQSLITKQNNLEAITAERNALRLQYEKLSVSFEFKLTQLIIKYLYNFRLSMKRSSFK